MKKNKGRSWKEECKEEERGKIRGIEGVGEKTEGKKRDRKNEIGLEENENQRKGRERETLRYGGERGEGGEREREKKK